MFQSALLIIPFELFLRTTLPSPVLRPLQSSSQYDFTKFFECCLKEKKYISSTTDPFIDRDPHKISVVPLNNGRVNAHILPKSLPHWPTFCGIKQEKACSCHIFYERIGDSHGSRIGKTISYLNSNSKVVSIGLAGISKSTEINTFLMRYLPNIGQPGWPMEVLYRFELQMIRFYHGKSERKCLKMQHFHS